MTSFEKLTVQPTEILVIDFASGDDTVSVAERHFSVYVHAISRGSFNYDGTRDEVFPQVSGEILVFITQDAIPASDLPRRGIMTFSYRMCAPHTDGRNI